MKGRILPISQLSEHDVSAWRDLAARALEPNPFCEPDCVIPAARYQSFGQDISLVVAEDDEGFHACMPIRPVREWYEIHFPIVANKIRRSTYVGTPLLDDVDPRGAMLSLFRALSEGRRRVGYRLLGIDSLRQEGPVFPHLLAAAEELGLAMHVQEDFERGLVRRREDGDYFYGRHRNATHMERKLRRLTEQFGGDLQVVDRSDDAGAFGDFVEMEAAGYKANTVALASRQGEPEYFTEMCRRFSEAGRLMALALEGDGHKIAMTFWLRGGDGLFLIKLAYDERYARFSPGTQLMVSSFEHFHSHTDAQWIDSCASPGNDNLLRLFLERTRMMTILFSLGNPVDAIVVKHLPQLRRASSVVTGLRSRMRPSAQP